MKGIIKILIYLFISVSLFGCAASIPAQTPITEDFAAQDSAAEDPVAEDPAALPPEVAYTSESETDPFGTTICPLGIKDSYFPLYAMIKEEDIYLYGIQDYGMILYQNGKGTYFDWPGPMPRIIMPEMEYYDFDGDGQKELAVILHVGSGTGFSLMDLHILEIEHEDEFGEPLYTEHSGKPAYTEYVLWGEDVNEWMIEPITATLSNDKKTIIVEACGDKYEVEAWQEGTFTGISYGDIVYFAFEDNQIKAEVGIAINYDESPIPWYYGTVEANVNFDGENFILDDYTFTLDDE